jgi:hypothetical protein
METFQGNFETFQAGTGCRAAASLAPPRGTARFGTVSMEETSGTAPQLTMKTERPL